MRSRYQLVATDITADSAHAIERFGGWSVRESGAVSGAVSIRFRDTDSTGQILAVLRIAADASDTTVFDPAFYPDDGVYVEAVNGTFEGVLYDWR